MVKGGAWASEGFGRPALHASAPSQVGATTTRSPRSNSPTHLLPRCRRTPAFAGAARGPPTAVTPPAGFSCAMAIPMLPVEVVSKMASFAATAVDLSRVRQICQLWRQAVHDVLWKQLVLRTFPRVGQLLTGGVP